MLVTNFGCWRQNFNIDDIFGMLVPEAMLKDRKPSSTSQSCRQHILSPTSVTNIDVAVTTDQEGSTIELPFGNNKSTQADKKLDNLSL